MKVGLHHLHVFNALQVISATKEDFRIMELHALQATSAPILCNLISLQAVPSAIIARKEARLQHCAHLDNTNLTCTNLTVSIVPWASIAPRLTQATHRFARKESIAKQRLQYQRIAPLALTIHYLD